MTNEWCSIADVYDAYCDCKKRKSKSTQYAKFAANEAANIYDLWKELNDHTYRIGYSDAFCVTRPKVREVFAAQFRDRIVHHLVMLRLLPIFEKNFIADTYNCRVGKGTDYGVKRLAQFMKEHKDGWVLKCDISCFFMNINKRLLWDMLKDLIDAEYHSDDKEHMKWLVEMIVMHRPELRCVQKGDLGLWDILPKGKSLFDTDGSRGLAIGNLTSQIFANYYLHKLDRWLSSIDGVCYGRYVDDFVLVSNDKEMLKSLLPKIRKLLKEECLLELHTKKIYLQPVRYGVTFIGSTIKGERVYAGNRTIGNATMLINGYNSIDRKEKFIEKFMQRYNSYMGYLIHRNTYGLRWQLWNLIDEQTKSMVYMVGAMAVMQVRSQYKKRNKLIKQYKHAKKSFHKRRIQRG